MSGLYKPGFLPGDIISFCDERFRVIEGGDSYGTVEYLDGEYVGKMYWEFAGEKAVFAKTVK